MQLKAFTWFPLQFWTRLVYKDNFFYFIFKAIICKTQKGLFRSLLYVHAIPANLQNAGDI